MNKIEEKYVQKSKMVKNIQTRVTQNASYTY